jgi:D-cysteine desulfhydrase
MSSWPLFSAFPGLEAELKPVALAALPTPVEALPGLHANAWIKRDDLSHPEYGGNKIRKLEFVLADMRKKGAREVITLGATGTNAGVAVSMVCRQERLACTIITFPQPPSATVEKNQAWMRHYGARFDPRPSLASAASRFYLHPRRLLPHSYFLFAGCSNPVSTFAYVNAAFELRQQIEQGLCPEPALIVVPVSSASTVAGLHLGVALAGLKTRVLGVRVAAEYLGPFAVCTPGVVQGMVRHARNIIARHYSGTLPDPGPAQLTGAYFGEAYGAGTPAASAAIEHFGGQGIALESTYSGKAAAAFVDALPSAGGPVLLWDTFNSRPLPETVLPV